MVQILKERKSSKMLIGMNGSEPKMEKMHGSKNKYILNPSLRRFIAKGFQIKKQRTGDSSLIF